MNKAVFYIVLFSSFYGSAQNLVPNGDFEYYTKCPDGYGQLDRAFPWYNPNSGSSDYYNECFVPPGFLLDVGVPSNTYGYQYALSGEGYAGLASIVNTLNGYEYFATPLSASLEAGEDYCVSFWITLADSLCLSVNNLGVYFSSDSIFSTSTTHINVMPQILWTGFIIDQQNWILVEGSFIAEGGENFMAIGTFDTTEMEVYQFCDDPFAASAAYYYIDDVSVQLATESCNSDVVSIPNVLTPNNDGVNDTWTLISLTEIEVSILNRWGNLVFHEKSKTIIWDGNNLSDGVYYYIVETKNTKKTGFIHLIR